MPQYLRSDQRFRDLKDCAVADQSEHSRPQSVLGEKVVGDLRGFLSNPEDTAVEGLAFVQGGSLALGVQLASPSIHYPFVFHMTGSISAGPNASLMWR